MKSKFLLTMLMATVLSAAATFESKATIPPPGGGPVVPGSSTVTGTLVTSMIGVAFTGQSTWSGTLDSYVYRNDPQNSFGGLTFVYQFHNTGGPDPIEGFTVGGWDSFVTDVYSSMTGPAGSGNRSPDNVSRSANGNILNWDFRTLADTVNPGDNSYYLIVRTNAISFTTTNASGQNSTAGNARALVASVPEGGSLMAAFGVALLGLEVIRRKVRRA